MSGASQMGRSVVRSAILIFLAILTFATTPARAQGTWLETRMIKGICGSEATPVANRAGTDSRGGAGLLERLADPAEFSTYVMATAVFMVVAMWIFPEAGVKKSDKS